MKLTGNKYYSQNRGDKIIVLSIVFSFFLYFTNTAFPQDTVEKKF